MGFGKAFGIGLVVFVVMNLVWAIIMELLGSSPDIVSLFISIDAILTSLFGAVALTPTIAFSTVMVGVMSPSSALMTMLLGGLYYIVPSLITAIIAGRMAKKGGAFGAMLLIMIISGIILVVGGMLGGATLELTLLVMAILMALINGIFYGGIAAVSAKSEGY